MLIQCNMIKLRESKRPKEIGKISDQNYCLYHQIIDHPTKVCYILKDKINALIKAGLLLLRPEQKMVIANMANFQISFLDVLAGSTSILKGELRVVNYDPMACKRKG